MDGLCVLCVHVVVVWFGRLTECDFHGFRDIHGDGAGWCRLFCRGVVFWNSLDPQTGHQPRHTVLGILDLILIVGINPIRVAIPTRFRPCQLFTYPVHPRRFLLGHHREWSVLGVLQRVQPKGSGGPVRMGVVRQSGLVQATVVLYLDGSDMGPYWG